MQPGITGSPVSHQCEDNPFLQVRNDIPLRLQHLPGGEVCGVAEQVNAGRPVKLPLVVKPGVKRARFGFRLRAGIIPRFTISRYIAVMLPGGDCIITHADRRIHRHGGSPVVVITRGDSAGSYVVPGPHIPDRFCSTVKKPRRLTTGQAHIKLVVKLAVGKNARIHTTHIIHLRAPVNPHLRQNALNELQIRFLPLGDNFTRRISAFQPEFKISSLQPVFTQHLLHHLRDGLVQKYGALPGVLQQCQTGAECKPVVGLVF